MTRDEIKDAIISILRSELALPDTTTVHSHSAFARDLRLDSDDLTFLFVPAVERYFSKHLSIDAWASIETVDDLIEALQR